ncbi:MAG: hypothetical protein NT069_14950 [Planctomycetota bacterium]|nr:hypothetical protein [Planctomycetota bacterium]
MFAVLLALVWRFFSRLPLRHTDLWGHLAYGRWIATHGWPTYEPLIPCASESKFIDTAWLAQFLWFQWEKLGGALALQQSHALQVTAGSLVAYACGGRATRSKLGGLVAAGVWLLGAWFQIVVIRPQQFGILFAGLVVWQLADHRRAFRQPLWLVPLFALWANLHGSFVIGWLHIGCALLARWITQMARDNKTPRNLFSRIRRSTLGDAPFRRLALGLICAIAATLLNPYGLSLHAEVLSVARHVNLADLTEWQPLRLASPQGVRFVAVSSGAGLLMAVAIIRYCFTTRLRRLAILVQRGPVLSFGAGAVVLGLATVHSARFIVWWAGGVAPLCALTVMAILPRPGVAHSISVARSPLWLALAALAWGVSVRQSPLGDAIVTRRSPSVERLVVSDTPLAIADSLRANPPAGPLFQPMEWGDYFLWAGPPDLRVFVASHVHLIPSSQWRDYMTVVRRDKGWREVLDRHQVTTVVLDRRYRSRLIRDMRNDPDWREVFADDLGVVFVRAPPSRR